MSYHAVVTCAEVVYCPSVLFLEFDHIIRLNNVGSNGPNRHFQHLCLLLDDLHVLLHYSYSFLNDLDSVVDILLDDLRVLLNHNVLRHRREKCLVDGLRLGYFARYRSRQLGDRRHERSHQQQTNTQQLLQLTFSGCPGCESSYRQSQQPKPSGGSWFLVATFAP